MVPTRSFDRRATSIGAELVGEGGYGRTSSNDCRRRCLFERFRDGLPPGSYFVPSGVGVEVVDLGVLKMFSCFGGFHPPSLQRVCPEVQANRRDRCRSCDYGFCRVQQNHRLDPPISNPLRLAEVILRNQNLGDIIPQLPRAPFVQ